MRTIVTASLLCFVGATAHAQACASIEDDLDRLACYDREAGRTPVATVAPTEGDWEVTIETSEFEDTTDVYLASKSEEPVSCNRFGGDVEAQLLIRCSENTTSVFLVTNCHLTDIQSYGIVDIRLDDEPAFKERMSASTDNTALGQWSGGSSIPLIKRIIGKDTMLVRFTPYSQSSVTARFKVAGLEESIAPLRESCGW